MVLKQLSGEGAKPRGERQRVSFERSGFLTADRLIKGSFRLVPLVARFPFIARTGFIGVPCFSLFSSITLNHFGSRHVCLGRARQVCLGESGLFFIFGMFCRGSGFAWPPNALVRSKSDSTLSWIHVVAFGFDYCIPRGYVRP